MKTLNSVFLNSKKKKGNFSNNAFSGIAVALFPNLLQVQSLLNVIISPASGSLVDLLIDAPFNTSHLSTLISFSGELDQLSIHLIMVTSKSVLQREDSFVQITSGLLDKSMHFAQLFKQLSDSNSNSNLIQAVEDNAKVFLY